MKTYKIKVGLVSSDNGDGSWSIEVYPSKKEAEQGRIDRFVERMDRQPEEDEIEDNEYDHGYLSTGTIELIVDENGEPSFQSMYFCTGNQ